MSGFREIDKLGLVVTLRSDHKTLDVEFTVDALVLEKLLRASPKVGSITGLNEVQFGRLLIEVPKTIGNKDANKNAT